MLRSPRWNCVTTPGSRSARSTLRGDHVDAAIAVHRHRIQRRSSAPESASRASQYCSIAECPVHLFDAALVLGGHVE